MKKIKIALLFIVLSLGVRAQSVVVNKIYNNTNTSLGGSTNGEGDGVELLVLEDHADLRGIYIKDFFNLTASSTALVEGSQFQFTDHDLWKDVRSGTTITLIRPAISPVPAPTTEINPANYVIKMGMTNAGNAYIVKITENNTNNFNPQGTDGIIIKRGSAAAGYDDVIHMFFTGYSNATLKTVIDAFTFPKMVTSTTLPGNSTYSGFAYANNPTAATEPHLGLNDYSGVDGASNDIIATFIATASDSRGPAWGLGEPGNNRTFIEYLRNAPKVESITAAKGGNEYIDFTVTFSKNVTGVNAADFYLATTETATGTIGTVTGSGKIYKIRVNLPATSIKGDIKLCLKGSGTGIADGDGRLMFEGFPYTLGATVQIGNVAIPPGQTFFADTKTPAGTVIGKLDVQIEDPSKIHDWSIAEGNENGIFGIVAATGEITLEKPELFNYKNKEAYQIQVTVMAEDDTSLPAVVTIELLEGPAAPLIDKAFNGKVTTLLPELSGTTKAGSTVSLYVDGILITDNISTQSNGTWGYKFVEPLTVGDHIIFTKVSKGGVTSSEGEKISIYTLSPGWTLRVSNIITPNGDGKNDTWKIDNIEVYEKNEVIVYNKAGEIVYRKQDYHQDWDGTHNGSYLPTGSYYYQVNPGNGVPAVKGTLTIIRP